MFFGRSRETQDMSLEQLNRKVTQMDEELKKLQRRMELEQRSRRYLIEEFTERLADLENHPSNKITADEYKKMMDRIEVLMKDSEDAEDMLELLDLSIKAETCELELFPVPEPSEDEKRKFREDQEGSLECSADLSAPS